MLLKKVFLVGLKNTINHLLINITSLFKEKLILKKAREKQKQLEVKSISLDSRLRK